jgi:aspartyl-tRNA(Asn)/glutamyl-tRNA(Gln) amidotransferase subunit B
MPDYEAVIGLETHIQLNTRSKIFCACQADSWGDAPNTNICPVCTGLPGVLPVLNRAAVEKAVLLAAAVGARGIHDVSYFARKNYFYPDLPKGYQISQYDEPLASGGAFDLPLPDGAVRHISIWKLHLEEDAGKTVHQGGRRLIDFNRCGVPLIEMVTGPDLRSADEAAHYLIRLRQLLRWLAISEGDMERGQLRCDGNVSLRPVGSSLLNPKTEIKNVNSIENLRAAIEAEIARQQRELDAGGRIEAWTLEWDEDTGTLRKMRSKETEADYRYFREPDLLPLHLDPEWRAAILTDLPELPLARRARFVEQYQLPPYDAEILTEERSLSDYFEQTVAALGGRAKAVSNWMMNDVLRLLRERGRGAADLRLTPADLAAIIDMVENRQITTNTGKDLLAQVEDSDRRPHEIVASEGLAQVSDEDELQSMARSVLADSAEQVAAYQAGKTNLIGWFVGQVMRRSGGKADPQKTRAVLEEMLRGEEG